MASLPGQASQSVCWGKNKAAACQMFAWFSLVFSEDSELGLEGIQDFKLGICFLRIKWNLVVTLIKLKEKFKVFPKLIGMLGTRYLGAD